MSNIKIYVEGGGDTDDQQRRCRKGFAIFFGKIFPDRKKPKVIACGNTQNAYDDFVTEFEKNDTEIVILLVDSDGPVTVAPWDHIGRLGKVLSKPNNASDKNLYFMTECTENWFFADKAALSQFYGSKFKDSVIPKRNDIENIPKLDVYAKLKKATADLEETYQKKHAFEILALVDPQKLNDPTNSPQAHRLIEFMENLS